MGILHLPTGEHRPLPQGWQPGLAPAPREAGLSDGSQGAVGLGDVPMKMKGSVLHADGRQLKMGSSLSLGKTAAFSAMLSCMIIRNSAAAEIHSLNTINNTALAAGLQTSCWGTRRNKSTKS